MAYPQSHERVRLIEREKLLKKQRELVRSAFSSRLVAHAGSSSMDLSAWEGTQQRVQILWSDDRRRPLGLIAWSPSESVCIGVWIVDEERGKGFARRLAELVAPLMAKAGVREIPPQTVAASRHRNAVKSFLKRLRVCLARELARRG